MEELWTLHAVYSGESLLAMFVWRIEAERYIEENKSENLRIVSGSCRFTPDS